MTLCLSLLFALSFFRPEVLADSPEDIRIGIVYGYRNTAKSGQLLPVTVTFENNTGETVDGFLSLEMPGADGSISYTSAVKIREGIQTEKRTVTVPDTAEEQDGSLLRAVLFDDSGEEIVSAETLVKYLGNGKEVLCGALSDNAQNLTWLSGISLGRELSTRVVNLNPADMPEEEDGLNQLDVIVISSFDTGRLSDACVEAVMKWTEGGGTLLIGTGDARNSLGEFRTRIGNPKLTYLGTRPVDMGMQYSSSGPDGAVLDLKLRSVFWDGAEVLQESFDRGNVYRKNIGKGAVCLTAFDLCDLREFCTEQPGYPQDLLTGIIGQGGLSRIAGSTLSAEERLTASKDLTNTYDTAGVPGIVIYVILAAAFLLLAGPVLFRLLSRKGLGSYYMLGVLILSTGFALIFWLQASATRITEPYIRYGVINEFAPGENDGQDVSMKGFIDMGSSGRSAMTLELPQECTVRPVMTSGNISVTAGKKIMLAVAGQNQFETNIFQVEEKIGKVDKECPLTCHLQIGENGLEGSVENVGGMRFSDLALIYSGEIYYFGGLLPGGRWEPGRSSAEEQAGRLPVFGPVNSAELAAAYVCRQQDGGQYRLQKEHLLAYCLRENSALSEGRGLLVGFAEDYQPGFLQDTAFTTEGSALFAVEVPVEQAEDTDSFRKRVTSIPRVLSGAYDPAENVIQGRSTAVLEYSLGTGFRLLSLEMIPLSPELDGESVTAFSGQTAMYNYATGSYDLTDAGKTVWTAEELAPYLSPGNNLTVRYMPDEDIRDDVPVFLPIPYIRGVLTSQTPEDSGPGTVPVGPAAEN